MCSYAFNFNLINTLTHKLCSLFVSSKLIRVNSINLLRLPKLNVTLILDSSQFNFFKAKADCNKHTSRSIIVNKELIKPKDLTKSLLIVLMLTYLHRFISSTQLQGQGPTTPNIVRHLRYQAQVYSNFKNCQTLNFFYR